MDTWPARIRAKRPRSAWGGLALHEWALDLAAWRAGDRDVAIGGGANALQQYVAAGLADEFELHVLPILLGGGEHLLDHLGNVNVRQVRVIDAPGVAHLKYRVVA